MLSRPPRWLRLFASWLDTRVNFGPRRHVVHYPAGRECFICEQWSVHDDSFHDDSWLTPTQFLRDLVEANRR